MDSERKIAIITGGSGFIGRFLVRDLISGGEFDAVYNLDVRAPAIAVAGETYLQADVRSPMNVDIGAFDPGASWLINLAAACREPGFEPKEYFDINTKGAENVTAFAESLCIRNLLFTSTMSSYGRMERPTEESAMQYPETPYGISKALAERIHRIWLERGADRRLIICRPGVIFGPGDKENIPRMIKAVRKGYFLFPGSPDIVKGYGYVYGLVDSFRFVRAREGRLIVYNYAERDCLPLRGMVQAIHEALGKRGTVPLLVLPMGLLVGLAYGIQILARITGKSSPIHPVRVRKVAFPTNLKPRYLIDAGFEFRYPFPKALKHWRGLEPDRFK